MQKETLSDSRLDLRPYIDGLLRWWWAVALIGSLFAVFAYAYTQYQTPIYQAATLIQIQQTQGSALPTLNDIYLSRALATTYKELISTREVLERTADELNLANLEDLTDSVSVAILRDTSILQIIARDKDPALAAQKANSVAESFKTRTREAHLSEIAEFMGLAQAQGIEVADSDLFTQMRSLSSISIVDGARIPSTPIHPRVKLTVLIALIAASILATMAVLVIEFFNDKARSPEDIERRTGLTRIATVLRWANKELGDKEVALLSQPKSHYAEAFRQAKVNVQFLSLGAPPKRYLVTSPGPGVGKTTFSVHLATALAQEGKHVILIDSDFRRPGVPKYFSLSNQMGLSSLLANPDLNLDDLLQPTSIPTLRVLTSGPNPPNSVELIGSDRLVTLLDEISNQVDVLVIDSAPILAVTDSTIIASRKVETILILDPNTRMGWLKDCLTTLHKAQATILGYVHNRIKAKRFGYGYNYYNYYQYYKSYNNDDSELGLLERIKRKISRG